MRKVQLFLTRVQVETNAGYHIKFQDMSKYVNQPLKKRALQMSFYCIFISLKYYLCY